MLKLLICPLKPYSPKRLKTSLQSTFEDETPISETTYGLRMFEKVDRHENTPESDMIEFASSAATRHTDLLLADKRPTFRQFLCLLYSARNPSEQRTLTLAPESLGNGGWCLLKSLDDAMPADSVILPTTLGIYHSLSGSLPNPLDNALAGVIRPIDIFSLRRQWIRGHGIPAFSVGRHTAYRLIPKPEGAKVVLLGLGRKPTKTGLLTNERIGNPEEIGAPGWEDQYGDGAFAAHSTKDLTVSCKQNPDGRDSKLPRTFSSQAGRKMDLALVRPLFDRPELPISYPRQVAVQAECGTGSYSRRYCPGGPGSDGCRNLEQCWTFLDGFRPDDQTQAHCTESGPSLPLLEMRPFLFADDRIEAAVIYGPIWSPSRTPWNPGTIAYSGLVATPLGSGRIQPSGESLSFQGVLSITT
ncbi:uncharacterized protein BO96DRAFT_435702 [Aspergillus niger CBS 101883]|uniref:uncharacterized protein n=1 Tax=Aspergillus lacticoffeatus (strain CBS 101883) TaxID=1450533 RepID=UPI000D7EF5F8|nr:uncharacterized protein BO96DRAFT_435702 [Aspergillus niger CBS 101883]PYH54931.1 hypothetical protein BO96DRAFT_435702 [Aspergillus niger CBS 101883]